MEMDEKWWIKTVVQPIMAKRVAAGPAKRTQKEAIAKAALESQALSYETVKDELTPEQRANIEQARRLRTKKVPKIDH